MYLSAIKISNQIKIPSWRLTPVKVKIEHEKKKLYDKVTDIKCTSRASNIHITQQRQREQKKFNNRNSPQQCDILNVASCPNVH